MRTNPKQRKSVLKSVNETLTTSGHFAVQVAIMFQSPSKGVVRIFLQQIAAES
jgi:hypothetical protein